METAKKKNPALIIKHRKGKAGKVLSEEAVKCKENESETRYEHIF